MDALPAALQSSSGGGQVFVLERAPPLLSFQIVSQVSRLSLSSFLLLPSVKASLGSRHRPNCTLFVKEAAAAGRGRREEGGGQKKTGNGFSSSLSLPLSICQAGTPSAPSPACGIVLGAVVVVIQ